MHCAVIPHEGDTIIYQIPLIEIARHALLENISVKAHTVRFTTAIIFHTVYLNNKGVWYMANIPRLRTVLRHNASRSAVLLRCRIAIINWLVK